MSGMLKGIPPRASPLLPRFLDITADPLHGFTEEENPGYLGWDGRASWLRTQPSDVMEPGLQYNCVAFQQMGQRSLFQGCFGVQICLKRDAEICLKASSTTGPMQPHFGGQKRSWRESKGKKIFSINHWKEQKQSFNSAVFWGRVIRSISPPQVHANPPCAPK